MSIRDRTNDPTAHMNVSRIKIPGVDHPVLRDSNGYPNGRPYQSTTHTSPLPVEPKVLPAAKLGKNGMHAVVSISVDPTDDQLPETPVSVPFESVVQYFNKTNRMIRITNRQNITFSLPRPQFLTSSRNNEYLLIRKIYRFGNAELVRSVVFNYQCEKNFLSIDDIERKQVLTVIDEQTRLGALRNNNRPVEIVIDRLIPITLFNEYMSLYVEDLDILIQHDDIYAETPHPISRDAVIHGEIFRKLGDRRLCGTLYDIVDNENSYSSKFVCMGKKIFQIPTNKDSGRTSGIYIVDVDNVREDQLRLEYVRHPLECAEELGIFSSKEEAENNGKLNDAYKRELLEREHELKRLNADHERIKSEREAALDELQHLRATEKIRMDQVKDKAGHEATLHELLIKALERQSKEEADRQTNARKDYYEQRSHERKDTSEILKWIPTIITTVVSITTMVVAISAGKTSKS